MQKENNRKISHYLLFPKFQARFILTLLLSGFAFLMLLTAVLYFFIHENYELLVELSPMTDVVKQELNGEFTYLCYLVAGLSLLFLLALSAWGLIYSHRIAGPIHQIIATIDSYKSGNFEARSHFRPKDEFHELSENLNELLDKMSIEKEKLNVKST